MRYSSTRVPALHRLILVLFAFAIFPAVNAGIATIIPVNVKINMVPVVKSVGILNDDHHPVSSQPDHLVKLIRQPGSTSYQALCCPVTLEESLSPASGKVAIDPTEDMQLQLTDVTVYPNPASDYLVVKNGHKANLYLFTCMGKQVYFSTVNHEDPIDITSVPCGCYTLKLEIGNRFRSLQLQVRR